MGRGVESVNEKHTGRGENFAMHGLNSAPTPGQRAVHPALDT